VNPATIITSQSTSTQSTCLNNPFMSISVTATGTGVLTYQWYKNTIPSNTGGTSLGSLNGAQTNTYTPQATSVGTLYYYVIVSGTCYTKTSSISGAFMVNPELVVTNTNDAGVGSLRQALLDVCTNGIIHFDCALNGGTINLTSGTLTINKNVTFDNCCDKAITITGIGDNITIQTASKLTLTCCSKFTVTGNIVNNAGVNGLVICGSLIENTCDLPATFTPTLNNKWHLFGSPFKQNCYSNLFSMITPIGGTTQLKPYTNGVNWGANVTSANYSLQPTVGYAVYPSISLTPATLTGNLWCTNLPAPCVYSIPLVYNGTAATQSWNLVSNPFTSWLDWRLLGKTNVSTTLYIWDNTLAIGPPVTTTTYFRTYNAANGVGVPSGTLPYIAPAQGFFARAIYTNPSLTIPLTARTHNTGTFFKDYNNTEILVRLKTETQMGYDELVICKNPDATLNYEDFDSQKMFDGLPVGMYSQASSGEKLVINTINDTNTVIPLSIIGSAGDKAKITAFDLESSIPVYLEDRYKGITINLSENSTYEFDVPTDLITGRFFIRFTNNNATLTNSDINVFENDSKLNIVAQIGEEIQQVEVFTLTGACVFKTKPNNSNVFTEKLDLSTAIYLVRVKTSLGTKNVKVNWEN
ncbi:MAG: T9SS type A sorting domain-containing protein, partial [Bacteroidota bacterium]